MKLFLQLFYFLFYSRIPSPIILYWLKSGNEGCLHIIAQKGHYKNRMYISNQLMIASPSVQLILIGVLIDDAIEIISQNVIKASKALTLTNELHKRIQEKITYWIHHKEAAEEKRKKYSEIYKGLPHYKRKFSNGESYQQMKQMLKKSMNIGKWI